MAPRNLKKTSIYDVINGSPSDDNPNICQDRGIFLDMPFLRFGYNWYGLLNIDPTNYDKHKATKISCNHLPEQGCIKHEHIINRLNFLNINNTTDNYEKIEKELELHRQLINNSVVSWLKSFILYVANEVGMQINNDVRLQTWNDYIHYVEKCIYTRDDAIKVMKTLYTSFQYLTDYNKHLTICVNYTYNLCIVNPDGIGNSKNFVEKMVTFRINQFRLQINSAMLSNSGFQLRIIRPRGDDSKLLDKCVPKY